MVVLPASGSSADLSAVLNTKAGGVVVGDAETWPELCSESALDARAFVGWRPEWKPASVSADELHGSLPGSEVAFLLHTSGSTGDFATAAEDAASSGNGRAAAGRPG